jgi:hypothetical protein
VQRPHSARINNGEGPFQPAPYRNVYGYWLSVAFKTPLCRLAYADSLMQTPLCRLAWGDRLWGLLRSHRLSAAKAKSLCSTQAVFLCQIKDISRYFGWFWLAAQNWLEYRRRFSATFPASFTNPVCPFTVLTFWNPDIIAICRALLLSKLRASIGTSSRTKWQKRKRLSRK